MSDIHEFQSQIRKNQKLSREAYMSWVRTVITIMTPSLVLLIGLPSISQPVEGIARFFLLSSILLMTLTILAGLALLHSESKGYHLLTQSLERQARNRGTIDRAGIKLPKIYEIVRKDFSWLTPLSIISLSLFGIFKYIT